MQMGFSQGAMMTAALVALQQSGKCLQDLPPFKFCILFAGLKVSRDKLCGSFG